VRVIAGTAKGRRLDAPPGSSTRPTADRVKEALFSALLPRLPEAHVLDLFAGSGALGIEALSRGAATATFVERDPRTATVLRHNLEVTDLVDRATVITRDVATVLASRVPGAPFDVVLADPPYDVPAAELEAVLAALVDHVADGAVVLVETSRRAPEPAWPAGMLAERTRRYGDTVVHQGSYERGRRA
jgi:16S rRNA (guanine966-N2)-methyltransferase